MGYIGQAPANKAITSADIEDGIVIAADIADDAITLAKMASGTDGNVISYDASGNPVAIATGSDGEVLTSAGAGQPPAFESVSAGTALTGSTNNTITTVTGANAIQGEAKLTFDGTTLTANNTTGTSATVENLVITSDTDANPAYANIKFTTGTGGNVAGCWIKGVQASGGNDGRLEFWTNNSGTPAQAMKIDYAGQITKPLQPAFYATLGGSNVTVSTYDNYNPPFTTEIYDQNADFNTSSIGVFTAPVTGKYLLVTSIRGYDTDTAWSLEHRIATSNRNYYNNTGRGGTDQYISTIVALADMDANDTADILINSNESPFVMSGDTYSYFHGHLVC